MNIDSLRINPDRLRADFDALAQFGATGDGGVHRPSLSEAHLAARAWFREQIEKAGLEFRKDGAGNHSAFLPPPQLSPVTDKEGSAKTLLLGSHLDSVPHGGRFDGALGVMCALEVLRVVKENQVALAIAMRLEAIDFTDEEGTLVGLLGSSAMGGHLRAENLYKPRGGRAAFLEGIQRAGLTEEGMLNAKRESLGGYLEVHIEQGKQLVNAGKQIGIVTNIVGISAYRLTFVGRADHAGSTTMQDRRDAAQGASAFALAAREIVLQDFPGCVGNVGRMDFAPGAFNIVPAHVTVALEFRAPTEDEITRLDAALIERAKIEAQRFGLQLEIEFLGKHAPSPMSELAQNAIRDACDALDLSHIPLVSGAGHDAQSLVQLCPVGMIFVPSVEGASHSPREFTEWHDCVNGANVLLHAALQIAA
ncbi:beta-ureidopropionase / N-carbamoyl-L-amino-acid hydrolase [Anaerolineae bacterium]|nr:beta-ureidopropionase / N-carbamoyl-L-amino-acid hydrolase [Anaerolineae bacterium]